MDCAKLVVKIQNCLTKFVCDSLMLERNSLLHKERLLKFDREFTQRTKIYDDQADYFSNSTSMWLTEDEQMNALEKDEARRKEMHERKKQVLDIAFD